MSSGFGISERDLRKIVQSYGSSGLVGKHGIIPEKAVTRPGLRHEMEVLITLACAFTKRFVHGFPES